MSTVISQNFISVEICILEGGNQSFGMPAFDIF
jgi:hypothetical protein